MEERARGNEEAWNESFATKNATCMLKGKDVDVVARHFFFVLFSKRK